MSSPDIRLFQFGGNNVNLFRGDVNSSLTLLTLPSRNNLDVSLTLFYKSNIQGQINKWNLDAPTGIVGLGWSLPYERIIVQTQSSTSIENNQYFLASDDNQLPLLASTESWTLFDLDLAYKKYLSPGTVSYELREQFAKNSIFVSEESNIEGTSPWTIYDNGNERVYTINEQSDFLEVSDAGIGFELQNYQFWKIRYYPNYEKWIIIRENGLTSVYGGSVSDNNGSKTSKGNVIQWGVCWGNWLGNSCLLEDQEQYALSWNLSSQFNAWGDSVLYTYEVVEQSVGSSEGLPYTKACYLSTITDVFKRKVIFHYEEKDLTQEVMDPHKDIPSNDPNAYQDRYETKYLDSIEVQDPDQDQILFSLHFLTETKNLANFQGDSNYGNTTKRYLIGIIQKNSFGDTFPGVEFQYYWDISDPHVGALKTTITPQGGKSTYTYRKKQLPLCKKSTQLIRPTDSDDWIPRIWFGSDYSVVGWYNTSSGLLQIAFYSWLGFWYQWPETVLEFKTDLNIKTLQVFTSNNACVLSYNNADGTEKHLYLFHKQDTSFGQWEMSDEIIYEFEYKSVELSFGDEFLNVLNTDKSYLDRYSWSWQENQWVKDSIDLMQLFGITSQRDYYISSRKNLYLILCYDSSNQKNILKSFYQDAVGQWHDGGTLYPEDIGIAGGTGSNFIWTLSDTFAVATYVTQTAGTYYKYALQIFHWDNKYHFTTTHKKEDLRSDSPLQFVAVVTQDSFIGSGPYLYRYNGKEWQDKKIDLQITVASSNYYWFSYGGDLALLTKNTSTQIVSLLTVYNPNEDSVTWESDPIILENGNAPTYRAMRYFPTSGYNYISLDKNIYFRGPSTDWGSSTATPTYSIPDDVDTTTIYNQAPSFFSYMEYEDKNGSYKPKSTKILNLENGTVKNVETFSERMFQIYNNQGYLNSDLSGRIPTGLDTLVTYAPMDKEWEQASSITLRRSLNAAVDGLIDDYAVTSIEVDDGYNKSYTAYEYDENTATCDPTGTVIKYYKVYVYPGCKDKNDSQDGYTETVYINGLPGNIEGVSYFAVNEFNNSQENYSALDGFIESQNTYDHDGTLIGSETNHWLVKTEKLTQWGNTIPLRGSYALLTKTTKISQGIQSESVSTYDFFSGQVIQTDTTNYNARGNLEAWTQFTTYGYQHYPILGALNSFPIVIQTKCQVTENDITTVTKVTATRLKQWQKSLDSDQIPPISIYANYDMYQWLGGDDSSDFIAWDANTNPSADWQLCSTITTLTNNGLVTEVRDALGHYASTLYDQEYKYQIASFSNARLSADEADYLGFESYEDQNNWKMLPSGSSWTSYLDSKNAHTGVNSLKLPAEGKEGLERTFQPADQNAKYYFTAWYKTEKGFVQTGQEAGWKITVTQNDVILDTFCLSFEDTSDDWAYVCRAIDLTSYDSSDSIYVTIRGFNETSFYVLLDNIRFSPFYGDFSANVYDIHTGLQTAALGPNKQVNRMIYDDLLRPIASIGPDENVTGITIGYLSQQTNTEFSPADPNASFSVTGMDSGFYSDFRRDGGYQKHWTTETPEQWDVVSGELVHSGSTKGEIQLNKTQMSSSYAVYLMATPQGSLSQPIGLTVGSDLIVQWEPSTRKWELKTSQGSIYSDPLPADQILSKEWLLFIRHRVVFFFIGGKKIFSYLNQDSIAGTFGLFTGDQVSFSRITVVENPQLTVSYVDGTGKGRQTQMLFEEQSVINQTIYDYLNRGAVTTKPAKLAPTTEYPLLSYRSSFVESLDWDTGIMTGEVSTYYSASGNGPTDDEGYPYSRSRFENSPSGRVIEQGQPGKEFAIRDITTTKPEDRHTTKTAYFSNQSSNNFMSWLPEGQYPVVQTTDADGKESLTLNDQNGNLVGQGSLVEKQDKKYRLSSYQAIYTNTGKKALTFLPNYYDPPDVSSKDKWQSSTESNMLGYMLRTEMPNVGTTEIITDVAGIMRFSQDEEGRREGYYFYSKYDEAKRFIESGIIEGDWDPTQLQQYANTDPSWPVDCPTWSKKLSYDGDGSDPTLMSRLVSTLMHGDLSSSEAANKENLFYDIGGKVTCHTLELLQDEKSYSTYYTYNNQGKVTKVQYPALNGTPARTYYYSYNDGGVTQSIGDSLDSPANIVSYTYNADGSVATENISSFVESNIQRTFKYVSPGWLKSISDPYFQQEMYYNIDSSGNTGYYTGLIAEEKFELLGTLPSGVTPSYSYVYKYDSLSQLIKAENIINGETQDKWSLGLDGKSTTYDSNGNILTLTEGNVLKDYRYSSGTDEIKNTTGSDDTDYTYNANGELTSSKPKKISNILYNKATGKEDEIQTESGNVQFQYNSKDQRLLKSTTALSRLYLHGLSPDPLIEGIKEGDSSEISLIHIYGEKGRIGFIKEGKPYLVITDRQGSTRGIVQQDGTIVEAYTYLPFGNFMDDPTIAERLYPYFYTSQELDEDLSLYNYKARFYDPDLGRFYGVDAANQFASPYLYGANNPILYIDPTGNMAWQAATTIATGSLVIALSIIAAIFTLGASTPAVVASVIGTSAAIGGSTSSISYSATHQNNWDPSEWIANVGIGIGSGLASAGAGAFAGAGVSAVTSQITSLGLRAIATLGAGAIVGGAVDSGVNVLSTLASNAISGAPLSTGLGLAAGVGFAAGAFGGFVGAIGGVRSRFKLNNKAFFTSRTIDDMRLDITVRHNNTGGAGIFHTGTGESNLGNFSRGAANDPFKTPHAQLASQRYGQVAPEYTGNRPRVSQTDPLDNSQATYPNLRGFGFTRVSQNTAELSFVSGTLNSYQGPGLADSTSRFLQNAGDRLAIMSSMRSSGIRVRLQSAVGEDGYVPPTTTENLALFFFRTPFRGE